LYLRSSRQRFGVRALLRRFGKAAGMRLRCLKRRVKKVREGETPSPALETSALPGTRGRALCGFLDFLCHETIISPCRYAASPVDSRRLRRDAGGAQCGDGAAD
jgi:hypothetical protein